jgi:NAD-dependent dihydropyrimidine dehydrogenase PreA subunit
VQIDKEKCIACKKCHPYCPMAAITLVPWEAKKKSEVDQVACVECGACLRSAVCPTEAIAMPDLPWPRSIRPRFSSPYAAPLPGLPGAPPPPDPKMNDVNGRIPKGQTAVVVEVGRPGIGTSLSDVEKICMSLARIGVAFDPGSSVTGLMAERTAGTLRPDVLNERVMHVMVHYSCPDDLFPASLRALTSVAAELETVFSVGFSTALDGEIVGPTAALAEAEGFTVKPHAKTNVGMQTISATEAAR